jgi:hypothetical protein
MAGPSDSIFATRFVVRSVPLRPTVPPCDRLFTFASCVKRAGRRNIFAVLFLPLPAHYSPSNSGEAPESFLKVICCSLGIFFMWDKCRR